MRQPQLSLIGTTPKHVAITAVVLCLAALSYAPRATATPYTLAPGGDNTALSSAYPAGGTVLDSTTETFSSSTLNGTVVATVIQGDTSNPYSGGLTFTYLLTISSTSPDAASELTVGSYGGFLTDVSYNAANGQVAPSTFSRSLTGGGNILQFSWLGAGLPQGDTGALIVVQTDATSYQTALGGVIDDSTANLDDLLAPAVSVPEATQTAGLFAIGLAALFVVRQSCSRRKPALAAA